MQIVASSLQKTGEFFLHAGYLSAPNGILESTSYPLAPSPHCAEHKKMIRRMLWLIADGDRRFGMSRQLRDGKDAVDAFSV